MTDQATSHGLRIRALRLMYIPQDAGANRAARVIAHADLEGTPEPSSRMVEKYVAETTRTGQFPQDLWTLVETTLPRLHRADLTRPDDIRRLLVAEEDRVRSEFAAEHKQQYAITGSFAYRKYRELRRTARRTINRTKGQEGAQTRGLRLIRTAFAALTELLLGEGTGSGMGLADFYRDHLHEVSRYAVAPAPRAPQADGRPANTFDDAPYIEPLPKDGTKGHLLEREALRYGFSSERFPGGSFVVADEEGNRLNFKWGRSPIASGVALSICSYKETTRRLLARAGIPVASGRVFSPADQDAALDYADRIGYPVVCKPVAGLRGIGVITNIRSRTELEEALELYATSELGEDDFVIEEQVPGEDYRIVIIDGEVVASVVREPASVVGDGLHTIADLIEYKNRARKKNPHLSTRLIPISSAVAYQLSHAGHAYDSVPEPGQKVTVANSANLTQGGDSFEVAHELHPSIKELAVRAVAAVPGLGFCGLDMLIEDHTKSVDEQRVTVIELNAHAAIGSAQYPMWGTPSEVAHRFFRATAAFHGIDLPDERRDTLSLDLTIKGRVTGVGYRWWLKHLADRFGVAGHVQNVNARTVRAHLEGNAEAVSALGYAASRGPRRSLVSSVSMQHSPSESLTGFEIRRPERTPRDVAKTLLRR